MVIPEELSLTENIYLQEFLKLNSYRTSNGFGPCPLDLQTIILYMNETNVTDRELFLDMMRQLDSVFIALITEKKD